MASVVSQTVLPDETMLRRVLGSAVRAPSVYNSQPWRWCGCATDGVDLFADPDRHLMTIDADGRDLLVSCGAALHHLVVALAGWGWSVACQRDGTTALPRPRDHLGVDVMVIGSPPRVNQDTPVAAGWRVWPGRWRRR
jgi:hypothetical protein